MKLTTTKISVPVLMLMLFQSGYGVSDWFEKASIALNAGERAEAYAVVQEAQPEKVGTLSNGEKTEFQQNWGKYIYDTVTNTLPLYYYEDGELTNPAGLALRNGIVTVPGADEEEPDYTITAGAYFNLKDEKITAENVRKVFLDKVIDEVYDGTGAEKIMNKDRQSAWLLMDKDLLATYQDPTGNKSINEKAGVLAWAGRIANEWDPEDATGETNKKFLQRYEGEDQVSNDPCVIDLRNNIHLTDEDDLTDVYNAIEKVGVSDVNKLTGALSNALKDVLAARIKKAAGDDGTYTPTEADTDPLRLFIQSGFDRKEVDDTSTTVINYGTETDPLVVISSMADKNLDSESISNAVAKVIGADLSNLLRHDVKTVSYKDLDNAIFDSAGEGPVDKEDFVAGLKSVTQSFSSDTTKTIVSDLKAIKNPDNQPPEPNSES